MFIYTGPWVSTPIATPSPQQLTTLNQVTLWATAIEHAFESYTAKGLSMPQGMRMHTDNATSEGKNNTCMHFAAEQVSHYKSFNVVDLTQFRVGHTHNKLDQRHGTAATTISNEKLLECPEDFKACLDRKVRAPRGRSQNVQIIEATINWKAHYSGLPMLAGHTQTAGKTAAGLEAAHSFRFMRRADVPGDIDSIFSDPPDPDDAVLLVRQYLSDADLIQRPMVFCPVAMYRRLAPPSALAPRSTLSGRQQNEFAKTAAAIVQPPWRMHKASAYLTELIGSNAAGASDKWQAPPITWVFAPSRLEPLPPVLGPDDLSFGERAPAHVVVRPPPRPTAAKSKAAPANQAHQPEPLLDSLPPAPPKRRLRGKQAVRVPPVNAVDLPGELQPAAGTASGVGNPVGGAPVAIAVRAPAATGRRKKLGPLPADMRGVILGCPKCRICVTRCGGCRLKAGLKIDSDAEDESWVWADLMAEDSN